MMEGVQAVVEKERQKYYDGREGGSKEKVLRCLSEVSSRILHYGQMLDVMVQHHPEYVSLVWGAMKFVLCVSDAFFDPGVLVLSCVEKGREFGGEQRRGASLPGI